MALQPLPRVPAYGLDREFLLDQANEEVTSIDIAPHGGFCIVACSNGAVLLFDMTNLTAQRNGYLLTHIRAKGMHTSLKLTVKISEDSRFCFVGVRKGSSDMIAIDLEKFDAAWEKFPSFLGYSRAKKQALLTGTDLVLPLFDVYGHNDPKLRGFGTATCVSMDPGASSTGSVRFWLACGMGIKNVHVWQLSIAPLSLETAPAPIDGPEAVVKRDTWLCIFDVATNGSSISHLGFRSSGKELLTKCDKMNIRVWDLSQYDTDASLKPAYEDIPNSTDVKCLMELTTFAFGGAYEFAVVKVDKNTPKEANRNVFDLPDKLANALSPAEDDASAANLRRRRATREIEDVIGTQDGMHALILCADGFAMHFYRQKRAAAMKAEEDAVEAKAEATEGSEDGDCHDSGQLQELGSTFVDMDNKDQCWALRRVGAEGHVLLLRAQRPPAAGSSVKGSIGTPRQTTTGTISITRLSSLVSKETASAFGHTAASWQATYSCSIPADSLPLSFEVGPPDSSQGSPVPPARLQLENPMSSRLPPKSGEKKRKLPSETSKADLFNTPSGSKSSSASPAPPRKTPKISPQDKSFQTPAASPAVSGPQTPFVASSRENKVKGGGIAMNSPFVDNKQVQKQAAPKPATPAFKPLLITPSPQLVRTKVSVAIKGAPLLTWSERSSAVRQRMEDLLAEWRSSAASINHRTQDLLKGAAVQSLPIFTQQQTLQGLVVISRVQTALIHDIDRQMRSNLEFAVLGDLAKYKELRRSPADGFPAVINRHSSTLSGQLLPRLRVDINAGVARDMIYAQILLPAGFAKDVPARLLQDCQKNFDDLAEACQSFGRTATAEMTAMLADVPCPSKENNSSSPVRQLD